MTEYIKTQESTNEFNETPFLVNNEPVMKTALELLYMLEKQNLIYQQVILKDRKL